MNNYDVYIIIASKDWPIVNKSLPYIKKNLGARNVVIVSSAAVLHNDLQGCKFLDESAALKESCGITYDAVKDCLVKFGAIPNNAGWFLQQFIKLGIARICKDDYYLVWDGDTIPLNPIPFFAKDGRPYFTLKREYFYAYFRTIKNLFGIKKSKRESFVSEHMLFNTAMTREMLDKIEDLQKYEGEFFWQKILAASDLLVHDYIKKDQRFFSEYETFGSYCDKFYKGFYAGRKLRTLRFGVDFLGPDPSPDILNWASKDFDTVSFERWGTPLSKMLEMVQNPEYRNEMSFANAIRKFYIEARRSVFRCFPHIDHEIFSYYLDVLLGKTGYDFFFGKRPVFRRVVTNLGLKICEFLDKFRFLYVARGRIMRYWRLLTYRF
ncbi:MAG: hypothetical protein IK015_00295 [Treponema sp.]|nr:hypothetical protein [Treponema sp.]